VADPTFAPPASRLGDAGIPNTPRPTAGLGLVANDAAAATATLTLTTTHQDVAGATVTLVEPGTYFIAATFDFLFSVAGAGATEGRLAVSGTAQAGVATLHEPAARAAVGQTWIVTTTARDVVAKLQAAKTVNAGTASAIPGHTTLRAFRIS
jgi:hypothetical protein